MTEGEPGRAEGAHPDGWSSEVRATVISVVVTALLNPIVARLDVVPLWGIILGDAVIGLVIVIALIHPVRDRVRRAAHLAWSLRPTFHLRVEQKQHQMLETNRALLETQRKAYEAKIEALERLLEPDVPRDYPEYVQEMIDLAEERNAALARASKSEKDLEAERAQTAALQASLNKVEQDLAEFALKAKRAGERATRAEARVAEPRPEPSAPKPLNAVTTGNKTVDQLEEAVRNMLETHSIKARFKILPPDTDNGEQLYTIENYVPSSIAREVYIEPDEARFELRDSGYWRDLSDAGRGTFYGLLTREGEVGGADVAIGYTDGMGAKVMVTKRIDPIWAPGERPYD